MGRRRIGLGQLGSGLEVSYHPPPQYHDPEMTLACIPPGDVPEDVTAETIATAWAESAGIVGSGGTLMNIGTSAEMTVAIYVTQSDLQARTMFLQLSSSEVGNADFSTRVQDLLDDYPLCKYLNFCVEGNPELLIAANRTRLIAANAVAKAHDPTIQTMVSILLEEAVFTDDNLSTLIGHVQTIGVDLLGISTYPSLYAKNSEDIDRDYYNVIRIAGWNGPWIVSECGWPVAGAETQADQLTFLDNLHTAARQLNCREGCWFFGRHTIWWPGTAFDAMGLKQADGTNNSVQASFNTKVTAWDGT